MTMKGRYGTAVLVCAIAAGLSMQAVHAQSTTGSIVGQVPAAAGESVVIRSGSGLNRTVAVDARGRYSATQLPLGTYTVTLMRDGKVVDSRSGIALHVGTSTDVSFMAGNPQQLGTVSVSANRLPPIDVTSVDSRTVVTSEQLSALPLGRSAESIALLAPGAALNTANFVSPTGQQMVSFGGAAANENAYYLNGFNTTDPLKGFGGFSLPYGAIDQEEVFTGGYGAQYGRSDGGVINVVGKRGTNQWHFGAQVLWEPSFARARTDNIYYANGLPSTPVAGPLYQGSGSNHSWSSTISAYVGGPLIKDRLFVFASVETERTQGALVNNVNDAQPYVKYQYTTPRWYAKVDWNINDANILELTGASDKYETKGTIYSYYTSDEHKGDFINYADRTKNGGDLYSAKYTGYWTDNLTVSAMYGQMRTKSYFEPGGYDPSLVYVGSVTNQNPALNGGTPITNGQTTSSLTNPNRGNKTDNLRLDVTYQLGDHALSAGIDNQTAKAVDQGSQTAGPGYSYSYGKADPTVAMTGTFGPTQNYANGAEGYYVTYGVSSSVATVRSVQRAQYIQDKWQVTDRLLLSLGLRNDQFTNYNSNGDAFIKQTAPQWAPRLGFSWDVDGDASFKVFGNAGRYYLALPLNPALNAAGASLSTSTYYTYSAIKADGTPVLSQRFSDPYSVNNYYGHLPNPKTVSTQGIKPEYQDEFILGFTKQLGEDWVVGAKGTQRILRSAIDDYCDVDTVFKVAQSRGFDVTADSNPVSCWLINPGRGNTFNLVDTSGQIVQVPVSGQDMGFQHVKRRYLSVESFLEHPFDGHWYGKLTYVWSHSYGNTEGQIRSDYYSASTNSGHTGASTTADWDYISLMEYAGGDLPNDHRHQIKLYGYYQFTPEWLMSANLSLISGAPKACLGYYGPDHEDISGYGSRYHWCYGEPAPRGGEGRLPWVRQLDLGVTYKPAFANGQLKFSAKIFNVTNEQTEVFRYPLSETSAYVDNPLYGTAITRQLPRYARFSVSYDF